MEALDLAGVQVLLHDAKINIRRVMKYALTELGFRQFLECRDMSDLQLQCRIFSPDLLILDIDEEAEDIARLMSDIRHHSLAVDPFVVAIATTWYADHKGVRAALNAGFDDILMKPISVEILNQRILNLIHNRRDFVATRSYVGPERRGVARIGTHSGQLQQIRVPNSLRYKATGDADALVDDDTVERAFSAILLQKVQRAALELTDAAAELQALAGAGEEAAVAAQLANAHELVVELSRQVEGSGLPGLGDIADSLERLVEVMRQSNRPRRDQIEIFLLHSKALSAGLIENGGDAEILARALKQAVKISDMRARESAAGGGRGS